MRRSHREEPGGRTLLAERGRCWNCGDDAMMNSNRSQNEQLNSCVYTTIQFMDSMYIDKINRIPAFLSFELRLSRVVAKSSK